MGRRLAKPLAGGRNRLPGEARGWDLRLGLRPPQRGSKKGGDGKDAMITIYGLRNCDSCRKAKAWLESDHDTVRLHDLRDDGVPTTELEDWLVRLGWERLLNRRSTTWRGLLPEEKEGLDGAAAKRLMLSHPTLIKRPVIRAGEHLVVGFSAAEQAALQEALAGL